MRLKATAISNLSDARYFAAMGVEFLGFNLQEGAEHYVQPADLNAFREWVEGPKIVGEFGSTDLATVQASIDFFQLDAVEIALPTDLEKLKLLEAQTVIVRLGAPFSKAHTADQIAAAADVALCFVLPFDVRLFEDAEAIASLKHLTEQHTLLFEFSGEAQELERLVEHFPSAGLSFIGGEEEKVGVKSFEELDAYFEVLSPYLFLD